MTRRRRHWSTSGQPAPIDHRVPPRCIDHYSLPVPVTSLRIPKNFDPLSLHSSVYQSLASLAPTYLTTDIHLVSEYGRRPLRSSTDRTLTVPRIHNRFGDRSFAAAGPRLWNSLPISLRHISSFGQFRRYLKNHLFGILKTTAQCDA